MRRRSLWMRLSALLAVAVLLLAGLDAGRVQAQPLTERLKAMKRAQQQTEAEMAQKRAQLGELERQAEEATEFYLQAQAEVEQARTALALATQQRVAAEAELAAVEAELAAVEQQLAQQQAALASRVRALYIDGRVDYLEVLFNATSFSDFLSRFDLLQSVVRQDARLLTDLRRVRREVQEKRVAAQEARDQWVALEAEERRHKEQADLKLAEAAREQEYLEAARRELAAALDALDAKNEEFERQIAELEREWARQRTGGLAMRFPVDRVEITDDYGQRWHPILGGYKMHYGVDFAVNYGTNVYAAESGTVLVADWQGAYGYAVIISHGVVNGRGVSTLYAHNSKLLVRPGQEVEKGQLIAKAGSTGWSTGPHVHMEVRLDGKAVNPWDFLPPRP